MIEDVPVHDRGTAAIRRAVDEVLAHPDYQPVPPPKPSWIAERWDEFVRWFDDLFGIGPGLAGRGLVYVLYGVIALLLLWLLVTFLRRAFAKGGAETAEPARVRAARVKDLLGRARAARARADFAEALRFYFWALVVGLSERGDLEYRDAWTNRELVERGKPRPEAARVLVPLVPELDAKSFGHVPALEADVDRLERLCREHLGGLAS
ncbi:MAG: hypothetical protein IPJ77_09100 [Planctomycetes bacterium]|nr:hypothetical protein [Planctomycetota bacterium]